MDIIFDGIIIVHVLCDVYCMVHAVRFIPVALLFIAIFEVVSVFIHACLIIANNFAVTLIL